MVVFGGAGGCVDDERDSEVGKIVLKRFPMALPERLKRARIRDFCGLGAIVSRGRGTRVNSRSPE